MCQPKAEKGKSRGSTSSSSPRGFPKKRRDHAATQLKSKSITLHHSSSPSTSSSSSSSSSSLSWKETLMIDWEREYRFMKGVALWLLLSYIEYLAGELRGCGGRENRVKTTTGIFSSAFDDLPLDSTNNNYNNRVWMKDLYGTYRVDEILTQLGFAHSSGPEVRFLQPLYNLFLSFPTSSHILFPGIVGLIAFIVSCTYFTWLDITHSCATKLQRDYWPSTHDLLWASIPQVATYCALLGLSHTLMPHPWRDPTTGDMDPLAPSFFRAGWEVAVCLVVGDFFIYWEHRIMHIIPYLRKNIHSVHHMYHGEISPR